MEAGGGRGGGGGEVRGSGGGEDRGRNGAGAGGGYDGGLRLLEQPLDGLPVGLVAQLPGELEDPSGAEGRHADPPPAAVHLRVPVLVGVPLRRKLPPLFSFLRRRHHLLRLPVGLLSLSDFPDISFLFVIPKKRLCRLEAGILRSLLWRCFGIHRTGRSKVVVEFGFLRIGEEEGEKREEKKEKEIF